VQSKYNARTRLGGCGHILDLEMVGRGFTTPLPKKHTPTLTLRHHFPFTPNLAV